MRRKFRWSSEFVKATRSQKKGAKEILRLGRKVYDFRKDLLEDADADNLQSANHELKEALSQKTYIWTIFEEKAKKVDDTACKSLETFITTKNRGLKMWKCFWSRRSW